MDRIVAAQVFVETVELGSATAAAEALCMSRAMASRYLAELEQWAGTRVLHRTTRRLSLTSAGERVLDVCREIVRLSGEIEVIAADGGNPHGLLRITAPPVLVEARLTELLAQFLIAYPRISVEVRASDRVVDLAEDRIDVAIRIGDDLPHGLVARRLLDCASVLCASPDYVRRNGAPSAPAELADHACLIYTNFGSQEWRLFAGDRSAMVKVDGPFRTNEALALRRAALSGIGIAMLPRFAVDTHLAERTLMPILSGWQPAPLPVHALYLSRDHMPAAARVLIDFLVERLRFDA